LWVEAIPTVHLRPTLSRFRNLATPATAVVSLTKGIEIGTFRLTVHQIPEQYTKNIVIASPPVVRESGATKLSFRVDSISRSRQTAAELGGLVYGPDREWSNDGTTICDGYDPDGNVFQLFQATWKKDS